MSRSPVQRERGFTLLELLIALALFAMMSAMTYRGLTGVLAQSAGMQETTERWSELQLAVRLLTTDLQQLRPRLVRDDIGNQYAPALLAAASGSYAVALTRGGWNNPAELPRSTQQRVAYRLEGDRLIRIYWPVLDGTLSGQPIAVEILGGVERFTWRWLDSRDQWQAYWPPPGFAADAMLPDLPRAAELTLRLADLGEFTFVLLTGS